jgi:hypothetical protein
LIPPKSTLSRAIALDLIVIAMSEATKQSRASYVGLDCFAEPVIRRRYAPTGWFAMTALVIPI